MIKYTRHIDLLLLALQKYLLWLLLRFTTIVLRPTAEPIASAATGFPAKIIRFTKNSLDLKKIH